VLEIDVMQAPEMMAPDVAAGNLIQQVRILAPRSGCFANGQRNRWVRDRSPAALRTPSIT
jgi:hypothetical protein